MDEHDPYRYPPRPHPPPWVNMSDQIGMSREAYKLLAWAAGILTATNIGISVTFLWRMWDLSREVSALSATMAGFQQTLAILLQRL
jgi:hypothetical protein